MSHREDLVDDRLRMRPVLPRGLYVGRGVLFAADREQRLPTMLPSESLLGS